MFSYSGRVKSRRRRQLRRADLRHFEIFRHGPIIIYTRLPAGGTYYPICMFPTNSERLIGISDAFSAFVYGYPSSCPRAQCTPNKSGPTLRNTRRHGPVYTGHACRHLPSAVPWISEDRLLTPLCVDSPTNKQSGGWGPSVCHYVIVIFLIHFCYFWTSCYHWPNSAQTFWKQNQFNLHNVFHVTHIFMCLSPRKW